MENKYYSPQDIAKLLQVAYMTVYRWIKAGKLKSYKAGKQYRVSDGDLQKFLTEKGN